MARYSVVLKVYNRGVQRWSTIVDSSTRSGASRKAIGILRQALLSKTDIKEKWDVDNYQYWKVVELE